MNKLQVTALVLTKNEENAIGECLKSLEFCDQVLVIDSRSSDQTIELVSGSGVKVIQFDWNHRYPKKKQWAMNLREIDNDWVLLLDADERISQGLLDELNEFLRHPQNSHFAAAQADLAYFFSGKKLKHGHKVKKTILMDRRKVSFPEIDDLDVVNMWEVEGHYQPKINGQLFKFKNKLIHSDPDPLYDYFSRHNRYSDWEAHVYLNEKARKMVYSTKTRQGKIFDLVSFRPLVFFLYSYLIKSGWRDGRAGFDYAVALSFYYWQIGLKTRERKNKFVLTKDTKHNSSRIMQIHRILHKFIRRQDGQRSV
jgi:glycosyltransferase involved in cell wall biosynthesis